MRRNYWGHSKKGKHLSSTEDETELEGTHKMCKCNSVFLSIIQESHEPLKSDIKTKKYLPLKTAIS